MGEAPSLIALCMNATKKEILCGEDLSPHVYELPSDLFDSLLTCLPPLALQKLQEQMPFENWDDGESVDGCFGNQKKRRKLERIGNSTFDSVWRTLYESRWPCLARQNQAVDWLAKQNVEEHKLTNAWQQMYWEAHLRCCLDAAAEIALLPSFDGRIGEVRIPDAILKHIGYEGHMSCSRCEYSKLSYHCQQFGCYARCLRLQNVLCVAETCHLLRTSNLQGLELRWIKSEEHVEGLCKLLNQNRESLKSLEFIHCKLSSTFVNSICDSLRMKDLQTHRIEHFSIKTSSFHETNHFSFPVGLASFLSSGRSLDSLRFCDNHVGLKFAKIVFSTLFDAASGVSVLDLSENNISGWLSHFRWRSSSSSKLSPEIGKSLQSLRVLNLRGTNLCKDDAVSLKHALVHMPNLEVLDISDNPLEDDGILSLMPYFVEMSERHSQFADLKVEDCELSCNVVSQLLSVLSTLKRPLDALAIGGNDLGSKAGAPLGKFLGTGIRTLDIEDIGLGPSGFLELQKEIREDSKLVYINMSKNRGGIETAKFLTTLIPWAPELVAVNAGYNFMPFESLLSICSALKVAKGKLRHVDLTGNNWRDQSADASMLAEFQIDGKPIFVLPSLPAPNAPYDDDP
ncbi:hypothetical protein CEY00_Acc32012 [Actinidia chinensis var. chinensis]|uniref:Uncharacterized protein n=1 Tax=Actinidia chinensis var. chinensis TaxID=1590841 RepID=A0A2R6P710_ACTCC|nr:hypothetical protein CEY00_Acc32012 [Actinidia chinensis var. chinensis]